MSGPDILSPEFARNPFPFYEIMRAQYPLYFHEGAQGYVLSRYEDVSRALKDPVFSTASYDAYVEPIHGRTILQMDGKEHTSHRNILNPAMRGADLRDRFVAVIERNARELMDGFRERGNVELISEFTRLFPISVILDMLGLPRADLPRIHGWYSTIIDFIMTYGRDPVIYERGMRTRRELGEYILPIIADRRQNPGTDLLSTLCTTIIDGVTMDDDEIRAFVSLLFTAGGETTDKAIALLVRNLIDHPEQLAMVREDRSLVDRAFAETMRYSAPSHMLSRTATEDVRVSGGTIPAGSMVILFIGSANRDEQRYENADRFDILRDDIDMKHAFTGAANHCGFGQGRHFCVGSLLARIEVNTAANYLLDAMDDIQYMYGPPEEHGFGIRGFDDMWLSFRPRTALAGGRIVAA